jgi:succinate-semialdehyde dehydrogenase/glutarate-semialdehyde dehydrogenase
VLTDVPLDAKVFNDEPFGPVAAIRGFNKLDEAIAEANRLPSAWPATPSPLAEERPPARPRLEVGMLYINQPATAVAEMPFGGGSRIRATAPD